MPFNLDKWVTLTTPRLIVVALDIENLYHYCHHYGEVQRNLGLKVTMEEQDREIQYVFGQAHYAAMNDPDNYLWYTSWEMILKSENAIIGGVCFKGPPDENGAVEIGYGIEEDYWNQGYTTEALIALMDWAQKQPEVKQFRASTEPENGASHAILKKLGFVAYDEIRGLTWWCKDNKSR
jgi:RimJ/RimL family protein N-acetyltransferase